MGRGPAHAVTPILLDTHVFVWALAARHRLPPHTWDLLSDPDQPLWLSMASAWELSIKAARGKLELGRGVDKFVAEGCHRAGIELVDVTLAHVAEVERLPLHHRDPFDRMLVAQARVERVPLLSFDPAVDAYEVERA